MSTTDTERLMICDSPFACAAGTVQRDEICRASDPRFQACPHLFSPADTPPAERPSILADYLARMDAEEAARIANAHAEFEQACRQNPVTLKAQLPKVLTARNDILCHLAGVPTTITRGSTILETDPLASQEPEGFLPKR